MAASDPRKAALVAVMAKHLPPSASTLRLLDIGGQAGALLTERRPDVVVTVADGDWSAEESSADAVTAYGATLADLPLDRILSVLRPGGRLIVLDDSESVEGDVSVALGQQLTAAGYVRLLVETGADLPGATLLRGERAHTTSDTLARVQGVAEADGVTGSLDDLRGRYVHLLVVQSPNKPAWKLTPDDVVRWHAAAVDGALLAFSSLPKAVALMQPAVVAGVIRDVNKVGKFSKATAQAWPHPVIVNPTLDDLQGRVVQYVEIDPATAEASDE